MRNDLESCAASALRSAEPDEAQRIYDEITDPLYKHARSPMNHVPLALVMALTSIAGCKTADAASSLAPAAAAPAGDTRSVSLQGPKMRCQSCAGRIREILAQVEGVQQVDAVPADTTVTVVFDASRTDAGKLIAALKRAGFEASEGRGPRFFTQDGSSPSSP